MRGSLLYKEQVGEQAANYISTATLIVLLELYKPLRCCRDVGRSPRRHGPQDRRLLGALTIAFEFGFGHYVDGKSWAELLHNHNVVDGRAWVLGLV